MTSAALAYVDLAEKRMYIIIFHDKQRFELNAMALQLKTLIFGIQEFYRLSQAMASTIRRFRDSKCL